MYKRIALISIALALIGAQAAMAQTQKTSPAATAYRFGGLAGSWLMPSGDFADMAGDGWAITVQGYQFINPSRKVAVGSEIGYQSFGKKNQIGVSNFPVDLVLRIFPKPESERAKLFVQGGLGFNSTRVEIGNSSSTDYNFGTQAGVGLELHGQGPAVFTVDAVYHWIFAAGTDPNFVALRGGILVPITR